MLYTDIPTHSDIESLLVARASGSVSIYLPTTPISTEVGASRIEFKNLVASATAQFAAANLDARDGASIAEALGAVVDDESFWAHQANSLAVLATPAGVRTFRLPNRIETVLEVSDRFHVKPLLRAVTYPRTVFVLALAQGSVRLVEVSSDIPPFEVLIDDLPTDVASAVGKTSIKDRAPVGRIHGSEGQKVRMIQYARLVDQAIRPILAGRDIPMILAATQPLAAIFRSVNSYPHLAAAGLTGNPETISAANLGTGAQTILDELYAADLAAVRARFAHMTSVGRVSSDVEVVARAATYGAVDTLMVDLDSVVPGRLDEATGAVTLAAGADAASYGILDEIARRAFLTGARVLAVHVEEVPAESSVAAILRYSV